MSRHVDTGARSRRRKALLAAGAVLGVGATATLAAWSDDIWVAGTFNTSDFNVQARVNPAGGWTEYATAQAAGDLNFSVAAESLSPGEAVFAPLQLRVDPITNDFDAKISLAEVPIRPAAGANQAFFDQLRVTIFNITPTGCNQSETDAGAPVIKPLAALDLQSGFTDPVISKDAVSYDMCFKVEFLDSINNDNANGGNLETLRWRFHAESVEP